VVQQLSGRSEAWGQRVKKTSGRARQGAVAVGFALLLGTATIPAAYADGDEPPLIAVVTPATSPGTGETPPVVESPGTGETPPVVESPGTGETPPVVESPGTGETPPVIESPGTGDTGSGITDAAIDTGLTPGENLPAPEKPGLAAPRSAPTLVPLPIQDGTAGESQEVVPAEEATPTPTPSMTSEPSEAVAPVALPEPVTKTIDAVVATATGSPLYVQLLTVLVLIGAGIAYFRVLGSKGTRVPSKSVK
jgi:hypothetical protein